MNDEPRLREYRAHDFATFAGDNARQLRALEATVHRTATHQAVADALVLEWASSGLSVARLAHMIYEAMRDGRGPIAKLFTERGVNHRRVSSDAQHPMAGGGSDNLDALRRWDPAQATAGGLRRLGEWPTFVATAVKAAVAEDNERREAEGTPPRHSRPLGSAIVGGVEMLLVDWAPTAETRSDAAVNAATKRWLQGDHTLLRLERPPPPREPPEDDASLEFIPRGVVDEYFVARHALTTPAQTTMTRVRARQRHRFLEE